MRTSIIFLLTLLVILAACTQHHDQTLLNQSILNTTPSIQLNTTPLPAGEPPRQPEGAYKITPHTPPPNQSTEAFNHTHTCPTGFSYEDGFCIPHNHFAHPQNTHASSQPSQNQQNQAHGTQNQHGNQQGQNKQPSPSITFETIQQHIPKPLRGIGTDFLGGKNAFNNLSQDAEEANLTPDDLERLLNHPLVGKLATRTSVQHIPLVNTSLNLVTGLLTFTGNLLMPSTRSTYEENSYVITRATLSRGRQTELSLTFASPASLIAYTIITPLTIYWDTDNDGEWDVKYLILADNTSSDAYVNIIKRHDPWVTSRRISINPNDLTLTIPLGNELPLEGMQRVRLWTGNPDTQYRWPWHGSLLAHLESGMLVKNARPMTLILLNDAFIQTDTDPVGEGEIKLHSMGFKSKRLEDMHSQHAQDLARMIQQGRLEENEALQWFLTWLYRQQVSPTSDEVVWQAVHYPVWKWREVNDKHWLIDDTPEDTRMRAAIPLYHLQTDLDSAYPKGMLSIWVFDLDEYPSGIVQGVSDAIGKAVEHGLDLTGPFGSLGKAFIQLAYASVSGKEEDVSSIVSHAFQAILSFLGRPELIGAPSINMNTLPTSRTVHNKGVTASLTRVDYHQLVTPLRVKVKLDRVKVLDRSDALRGEFYLEGRVCTRLNSTGMTHGHAFVIPHTRGSNGKTSCQGKHPKHGTYKVWDGDTPVKNQVIFNARIRDEPFLYLELNAWDEDAEHLGDDDDPLGSLVRIIPLDEALFTWPVESDKPILTLHETVRRDKVEYEYTITIQGV